VFGLSCATFNIPYNRGHSIFDGFFDNARVLMRWAGRMTLMLALTLLGLAPGHADQRVALVIGNSGYRYVSPFPTQRTTRPISPHPSSVLGSR